MADRAPDQTLQGRLKAANQAKAGNTGKCAAYQLIADKAKGARRILARAADLSAPLSRHELGESCRDRSAAAGASQSRRRGRRGLDGRRREMFQVEAAGARDGHVIRAFATIARPPVRSAFKHLPPRARIRPPDISMLYSIRLAARCTPVAVAVAPPLQCNGHLQHRPVAVAPPYRVQRCNGLRFTTLIRSGPRYLRPLKSTTWARHARTMLSASPDA